MKNNHASMPKCVSSQNVLDFNFKAYHDFQ